MLVLSVKDGDYVMIDNKVMVRVMKTATSTRLAFDAPKEVQIMRGSLFEEQNAHKLEGPKALSKK